MCGLSCPRAGVHKCRYVRVDLQHLASFGRWGDYGLVDRLELGMVAAFDGDQWPMIE